MSDQHITNANEIRSDRYEIEARPLPVGGGWRIRFFGRDLETGQEIEMGGGVFPVEDGQDERDVYAEAEQTGQEWLQLKEITNDPH